MSSKNKLNFWVGFESSNLYLLRNPYYIWIEDTPDSLVVQLVCLTWSKFTWYTRHVRKHGVQLSKYQFTVKGLLCLLDLLYVLSWLFPMCSCVALEFPPLLFFVITNCSALSLNICTTPGGFVSQSQTSNILFSLFTSSCMLFLCPHPYAFHQSHAIRFDSSLPTFLSLFQFCLSTEPAETAQRPRVSA